MLRKQKLAEYPTPVLLQNGHHHQETDDFFKPKPNHRVEFLVLSKSENKPDQISTSVAGVSTVGIGLNNSCTVAVLPIITFNED